MLGVGYLVKRSLSARQIGSAFQELFNKPQVDGRMLEFRTAHTCCMGSKRDHTCSTCPKILGPTC